MRRLNAITLATLIEECLHGIYAFDGDWEVIARADENIVAFAFTHYDGPVHEFRAVIVEGDAAPVVAARPDLDDPAETCGPGIGYEDDPHIYGWTVGETGNEVVFGGTGHISHEESRRAGAALIAVADAHDDRQDGGQQ